MGSGIAEASARAGMPVTLYEPGAQALDRSRDRIRASLDRAGPHAHASGSTRAYERTPSLSERIRGALSGAVLAPPVAPAT